MRECVIVSIYQYVSELYVRVGDCVNMIVTRCVTVSVCVCMRVCVQEREAMTRWDPVRSQACWGAMQGAAPERWPFCHLIDFGGQMMPREIGGGWLRLF